MLDAKVVVVDDEQEVLDLLRDILTDAGLAVTTAARAEKVGNLADSPPDLMLVDLMLPGSSGIELAQKVRESGMKEVPLVAMSASDSMLGKAVSSHLFQDVLPKPFDISELLSTVDRHLHRSPEAA